MNAESLSIVHTEASCGWGGQELRVLSEAQGLIGRGHRVRLVCPARSRIYREAPAFGVPADALPIDRKKPGPLVALRGWLRRHRPDVINTHSSTDTWLAALACASLREPPPIVRTRHISAPVPPNAASRWLYAAATRHVVTTGERLRQVLMESTGLSPDRVSSVPTGIDTERFRPGDRDTARRALGLDRAARWIGIVATLRSWKGHLYLLDAICRLARPEVRLAIVGDGPMRGPLVGRIAELGIGERVCLAGEQSRPEDWLRAFDLFCLPSYANEGIPQALMQAMATGLPVITTPVGSITEAVSDGRTGVIVRPEDAEALAGAIGRLLDDPAFAARLGEAARREAVGRFGRERMLDRMEAIFRNARGRSPIPGPIGNAGRRR